MKDTEQQPGNATHHTTPPSASEINKTRRENARTLCADMANALDSKDREDSMNDDVSDPKHSTTRLELTKGKKWMWLSLFLIVLVVTTCLALRCQTECLVLKENRISDYVRLLLSFFFLTLIVERSLEVIINTFWEPLGVAPGDNLEKQTRAVNFASGQIKYYKQELVNTKEELTKVLAQTHDGCSRSGDEHGSSAEGGSPKHRQVHSEPSGTPAELKRLIEKTYIVEMERLTEKMHDADEEMNLALIRHDFAFWADHTNSVQKRLFASILSFLGGAIVSVLGFRILEVLVTPDSIKIMSPYWMPQFFRTVDILITAGLIAGGSDGVHKIMTAMLGLVDELRKKPELSGLITDTSKKKSARPGSKAKEKGNAEV